MIHTKNKNWKLIAPFIILLATVVGIAQASVITVENNCSLNQAIESANTNTSVALCNAGDDAGGSDTILLTTDIVVTGAFEDDVSFGRTATPAITSAIILDGNGHSLERDASFGCVLNSVAEADEFRLLRVASPGNLDLRNIILKNGCADGTASDKKIGGGVLNFNANLQVSNSIFINNSAELRGGGIDTTFAVSTVRNSYFKGNKTNFGGAGLSNFTSTTAISDSTFHSNIAGNRGGAIFNVDGASVDGQNATLTLVNSTISGNQSAQNGGGIYNENALIASSLNSTFSGNSAANTGGAIYNKNTGSLDIAGFLYSQNGGGSDECFNDGGSFVNSEDMTDNSSGGCSDNQSAQINLLPLADYGCTTPLADGTCIKTHALGLGSLAINPAVHFIGVDQRGFNINGRRDIGAYEFLTGEQQCTQSGLVTATNSGEFSASVSNPFELNQAITCANLDATTTDTINLSTDISLNKLVVENDGQGATGTPLITTPMIIDGNRHKLQRDLTFVCDVDDVEVATEFRILKVTSSGELTLNNITLENGCVDSDSSISRGAGILNKGTLAISNSTITRNTADFGAGISNSGPGGVTITLLNGVIISHNTAGFKGGGIENTLATIDEITHSIIKNNTVLSGSNGKGGGVFNDSTSTIGTISHSSIVDNTSTFDGAGIFNDAIIESIFSTTFSGNQATNFGGGIHNRSTLTSVSNTTFSGNRADKGGAIFTSSSIGDIQHSTFYGNQADSAGGALFSSGGISQVNNSLFSKNLGTRRDCGTESVGDIDGSNNLSGTSGSSNNCDATIAGSLDGNTVAELADNGCVGAPLADGSCTKTHALLATSQAIDFIASTSFTGDQRSFMVVDAKRDAGAYEFISAQGICAQTGIDINAPFTQSLDNPRDFIHAINCANFNLATTDTINLTADIMLPEFIEDIDTGNFNDIASKGRTGTPAITSPLGINGMGFSLMRDNNLTCGFLSSSAPENPDRFRLLRITAEGSLDLDHITLANGCVSQDSQNHKFYGGAIYNEGNLTLSNSIILNNGAASGAGIYNFNGNISEISNSIFYKNDAFSFYGGGLVNDGGQIVTIINNAFTENSVFYDGGGLANIENGNITTMARNTFDKNSSNFSGSGLYNALNASIDTIKNSTFSNNLGSAGIGITNQSLISSISNSTFTANNIGIQNENGTITSINNSILDSCSNNNGALNGTNNLSSDADHNCPGTTLTSSLNINPSLEDNRCVVKLADDTCIKTHALLTGSDAIDQGDANATDIDQRGFDLLGTRDIGAFEFDSPTAGMIFSNGFED